MIADISSIKNSEGKITVNETVEFGTVTFGGGAYEFKEVSVVGSIINIGGSLELKATATGEYITPCARCLKPVMSSFDADIYEDLTGEDANDELIAKDGNEWDLTELILSDILLELPMTVLCSEDCKGFCPTCGKNLNSESCTCESEEWDPRFDILKNFKADL
ncbi:MAG: DUF177 domain-containing protein [Clostridia bacterium]|nr:DUF177 domain-containing protein [Clostridia bacterium]